MVTMKTTLDCFDGPDEVQYGFPLGWMTPSIVVSLDFFIDWRALAIDFFVYFGFWFALSFTGVFSRIFSWRPRIFSAALWLVAAFGVLIYIVAFSLGGRLGGVTFDPREDCTHTVSRELKLGPQ